MLSLIGCGNELTSVRNRINDYLNKKQIRLDIKTFSIKDKELFTEVSFDDYKFSNEKFQLIILQDILISCFDSFKNFDKITFFYYLKGEKGKLTNYYSVTENDILKLKTFYAKNVVVKEMLDISIEIFDELTPYDFEYFSEEINKNISSINMSDNIFEFLYLFGLISERSLFKNKKIELSESDFIAYLLIEGVKHEKRLKSSLDDILKKLWEVKYKEKFSKTIGDKKVVYPK